MWRAPRLKRWITLICGLFLLMGAATTGSLVSAQQKSACPKAPVPHLKSGSQAKILISTGKDIPGAALKSKPDHVSPVLRYLPLGSVVTVDDGPTCGDDGTNWWTVSLGDLKGYLDETNVKVYALQVFTGTAPDT